MTEANGHKVQFVPHPQARAKRTPCPFCTGILYRSEDGASICCWSCQTIMPPSFLAELFA